MAQDKQSYRELQAELDEVLAELQSDTVDVDEALTLYKKGQELLQKLDARLKAAEHTLKDLS